MQTTPIRPTEPMYQVAYGARSADRSSPRLVSSGIAAAAISAAAAAQRGMSTRRPTPITVIVEIVTRKISTESSTSSGRAGGDVHHSARAAKYSEKTSASAVATMRTVSLMCGTSPA